MAGRVEAIITRARDTLADPSGERWSDARLLRILDEGQKQIVLKAKLLREKASVPLLIGIADYAVPTNCYKILRILVDGTAVPLVSHEEMDAFTDSGVKSALGTSWENYQSYPVTDIVFDKLNTGTFKTYPIPEHSAGSWTVVSESGDVLEEPYGLLMGATGYTNDSNYGISISFSDDFTNIYQNLDSTVDDDHGLTVIFDDNSEALTIYYLKRPAEITGTVLADIVDPEIDSVWDTALKHYVTGMALRDDKDSQNRQVGNEELQLYGTNVAAAMKDGAQDFTATRTQYGSNYNNGFLV